MKRTVAILGASPDPERYSYKAFKLLLDYGHSVFLIHPKHTKIEDQAVYSSLTELKKEHPEIDTVTLYVNPTISSKLSDELLSLAPGRVIFNPGSENPDLANTLKESGIAVEEACTLVLLKTGQF